MWSRIRKKKSEKKRFNWEINLAFGGIVCDIPFVKEIEWRTIALPTAEMCVLNLLTKFRSRLQRDNCHPTLVCLHDLYSRKTIWTNNVSLFTAFCVACEFSRWLTAPNWLCVRRLHEIWKLNRRREIELNSSLLFSVQCGVQLLIPNCIHNRRSPLLRKLSLIITKKTKKNDV